MNNEMYENIGVKLARNVEKRKNKFVAKNKKVHNIAKNLLKKAEFESKKGNTQFSVSIIGSDDFVKAVHDVVLAHGVGFEFTARNCLLTKQYIVTVWW